MKKYEILKGQSITIYGRTLYRIRALRDFGNVKKGDIGGYVQNEYNLSHDGECWVYNDAMALDNSRVLNNARMYNNSRMYGHSEMFDNTEMHDNSKMFNDSKMFDNSEMYDNSEMHDSAEMHDYSKMFDNSKMLDYSRMYDNSEMYDNAKIFNFSKASGNVKLIGNAKLYANAHVKFGVLSKDIQEDMVQYIACSLNVYPVNGKYILYKRVNKDKDGAYASLHDSNLIYRDGEIAEVKNLNLDFAASCAPGIHVSTPFYWNEGDTLIAVEVEVEDIITCMEGKIRCKKVKVIGEVDK